MTNSNKTPRKDITALLILTALGSFILFGFVFPSLISSASDTAVILGLILLAAYLFGMWQVVKKIIAFTSGDDNSTNNP